MTTKIIANNINTINNWKEFMQYNENLAKLSVSKYSNNIIKLQATHDLINYNYFELTNVIKELRVNNMSLNTINNYIVSLKKYFSFLYDMEFINNNPTLKLKTFKIILLPHQR